MDDSSARPTKRDGMNMGTTRLQRSPTAVMLPTYKPQAIVDTIKKNGSLRSPKASTSSTTNPMIPPPPETSSFIRATRPTRNHSDPEMEVTKTQSKSPPTSPNLQLARTRTNKPPISNFRESHRSVSFFGTPFPKANVREETPAFSREVSQTSMSPSKMVNSAMENTYRERIMPHQRQTDALRKRYSQYLAKSSLKRSALEHIYELHEDWQSLDKLTFRTVILAFNDRYDLECRYDWTIGTLKDTLWAIMNEPCGAPSEYVLSVDGDDFLVNEDDTLGSIVYIHFCRKINLLPTFHVKELSEYHLLKDSINAVVGKRTRRTISHKEYATFTKNMNRVRYEKYLKRPPVQTNLLSDLYDEFYTRIYMRLGKSQEISVKTVQCRGLQTVGEFVDGLFIQYGYLIDKDVDPSDYALKFKGTEEYLIDFFKLMIEIKTVQEQLRARGKVDVILMKTQDITIPKWFQLTEFYDQNKFGEKVSSVKDSTIHIHNEVNPMMGANAKKVSIFKNSRTVSLVLKVTHIKDLLDREGIKFNPKQPVELFFTVSVKHYDTLIFQDNTQVAIYNGSTNSVQWPSLGLCPYNKLTYSSAVTFTLNCRLGRKTTPLAWVNRALVNYMSVVAEGKFSCKMWPPSDNREFLYVEPAEEGGPQMTYEIPPEDNNTINILPELMPLPSFQNVIPSKSDVTKMTQLFNTDPLYIPTKEERSMLWTYREYCSRNPISVLKFVWAIPWGDSKAVEEAYSLLTDWPLLPQPAMSLELLKPRFADKKIREYTVRNLEKISDNELSDYLLQLVQAVRHEMHPDCPLSRFLMSRALMNRAQIGHNFFWFLKAQLDETPETERYDMLLEAYLQNCGNYLAETFRQTSMGSSLMKIAAEVAVTERPKRKEVLTKGLLSILLPTYFQTIITPTQVAKGINIEKCKFMDSKTVPVWIEFENIDKIGDKFSAILKIGDDLRQDQLTLQMMNIMDNLWLKAGLDLKMIHYKVVATGPASGWVEVVEDSTTTAHIQKEAGGISGVFNEKTLYMWLKKMNPSKGELSEATETFIKSCAASCVATYVLGIGDRHNDNIMINRSGQLFHIDFGKFLGNAQMFLNIKRDRAPFVFTPDMAYVMGGIGSENFQTFVTLCCQAYNIVRREANTFINLFAMMLNTGIPELRSEKDLEYVRQAFALKMSEEEAARHFTSLIHESIKAKSIQLNFAIHLMAKPG
ncbi:hypothetical protein PROFUN_03777 [Planoprotostelium fungivorum]|uniref:Phosphatidylinositol 3-kinase n=1 Tax=Planoprotostelium fungivorum TaxID=1890364 RepID=A0A2P6NDQ5_9EUKA|nr:hypothetical protein PROFUN_03777 [Planoprotostelium fungivorum]